MIDVEHVIKFICILSLSCVIRAKNGFSERTLTLSPASSKAVPGQTTYLRTENCYRLVDIKIKSIRAYDCFCVHLAITFSDNRLGVNVFRLQLLFNLQTDECTLAPIQADL